MSTKCFVFVWMSVLCFASSFAQRVHSLIQSYLMWCKPAKLLFFSGFHTRVGDDIIIWINSGLGTKILNRLGCHHLSLQFFCHTGTDYCFKLFLWLNCAIKHSQLAKNWSSTISDLQAVDIPGSTQQPVKFFLLENRRSNEFDELHSSPDIPLLVLAEWRSVSSDWRDEFFITLINSRVLQFFTLRPIPKENWRFLSSRKQSNPAEILLARFDFFISSLFYQQPSDISILVLRNFLCDVQFWHFFH